MYYTILSCKIKIGFNFTETFRKILVLLHFLLSSVGICPCTLDNAALLLPLWKRLLPFIKLACAQFLFKSVER